MTEIGRKLEIGFAPESSRGVAESTVSKWAKHVSADIIPRVEKAIDDNTRGRLEDSEGARVVKKWFDGTLEGILHVDTIGYLFANIYGAPVSTVVEGDVMSHAFTMSQSIEHPTFSLFRKDGSVNQKVYGGGVVKTLEISAVADNYVRFSADIAAANEASNSSTPSYDTEYDFIGKDVTVKMADTSGALAGATALKLKDVNISWDNSAIVDHVLGNLYPDAIYNGASMIEVTFTKNYVDTTFEDLFKSDAYKYMSIAIEGNTDIGDGNFPGLVLTLNKAQVQSWERSGGGDELVTEEVTIKAFFNQTDLAQSGLTLKNLTATYAG
ncbi:MAG TPA: phage tail tube protein [Candidatus Paceibacterota bacterium]